MTILRARRARRGEGNAGRLRPARRGIDAHHIRHKSDGGETSLHNLALFCEFHHETCIHRWGWQVTLHPDGTTQARSPDGRRTGCHRSSRLTLNTFRKHGVYLAAADQEAA